MKQKEITIAGKQVAIAYCYATEINFQDLSGKTFRELIDESENPSSKDVVYAILAAAIACANANGKESPITDADIIYHAEPEEIVTAMAELMTLCAEWYRVPGGYQPQEADEDAPKN